ncbi:meiosis protein SPO22/ZIP4 like-domain-containing protein [Microdochium trichocladiopsis]|uniref:Meiosis protein SPO22/ZIP4 like-domain-containing protein n=1 Tax=Microdochium trichocladiopsis TaxID=1682393 RepID=A0A9P8XWK1_9PEZI|nr:meiosis protein SPO22/ZIP4 like-domain-containing protein [Microdochium trichocladiopsis]KAH7021231.1 meiosis protein SPO22/ZIP4 like-domain-containing protein [Microdochium trichocladiopsis]
MHESQVQCDAFSTRSPFSFSGEPAFCHDLRREFPHTTDAPSRKVLEDKLESHIHTVASSSLKNLASPQYQELDTAGTDLWNLCARLRRQSQHSDAATSASTPSRLLTLVRLYSFMILALAQSSAEHHSTANNLIRLHRLAIKTGRACIDEGEISLASDVLRKAVEYKTMLSKLEDALPEGEGPGYRAPETECWMLQTTIAWKDNRLELVEHFHTKLDEIKGDMTTEHIERFADTIFAIGQNLSARNEWSTATKWLQRAYIWINTPEIDQLSKEGAELRLAITRSLIQAHLHTEASDNMEQAENLIQSLEGEIGNTMMVLLLRLEILVATPGESFDSSSYASVMRRMIETTEMSDITFKVIVHHIRKLEDKSPSTSMDLVDQFLRMKVLPTTRADWIERLVVLRTHMATSHRETEITSQGMTVLLDQIKDVAQTPFSATATNAIQTIQLLWKKIDANYSSGEYALAVSWCRVALHPMLEQCGPVNAAKISRKLLICAAENNDLETAIQTFRNMSESARNEPSSLFLGFKIGIQSENALLAQECLDSIAQQTTANMRYLYACCLEAQKVNEKSCVLSALQHIARKYDQCAQGSVHTPALLRSIIRLQLGLLNDTVHLLKDDPRDEQGDKLFTIAELDWFCKNAYNLGLKHTATWDISLVVRLFEVCISVMQYYPPDLPAQPACDILLRNLFCHFMVATALLAIARAEDNIEKQLQHYLIMRKKVKAFDEMLECEKGKLDDVLIDDLELKLSTLLVFDFEGAICLKSYDDLDSIILRAKLLEEAAAYQAMADCLLRAANVPSQTLYATLRKLANEIWALERFNVDRVAKYMRCLLQAMLPCNPDYPLRIIEEVVRFVKEAAESDNAFPDTEVEWFIATAFNHGVDLYGNGEDELSKKWFGYAMTLAHYYQDGGIMEKDLQERSTRLQWDG